MLSNPIQTGFKSLLSSNGKQALRSSIRRAASSAGTAVMAPATNPSLGVDTLNSKVLAAEYAVRGEIVRRAQTISKELESGAGNFPFDKVVYCNIGNPQILGQTPITYFRQVLSLCEYPELLDSPLVTQLFAPDVISRARELLAAIPGGIGAYSDSAGVPYLRQLIATAMERRDGFPCDPEDLYMTDGASVAVHYMMEMLIKERSDGFMVPIPQYPLYSATLALYGGKLVPYMLDESQGWGLGVGHLRQQLAEARAAGTNVRGMVVINPGNPTGQCLSKANMEDIIGFCRDEGLVLIADEVYQTNMYAADKQFFSFKKVMRQMGPAGDGVALVSLHSTSKGFVGECGRRGGYMEVLGFPSETLDQILKMASINLCPNVSGQICCALMMTPPRPGDASYELYQREKQAILGSLQRRAKLLVDSLNKLPGITCNPAEGALYAFPRVHLPPAAVEAAGQLRKEPDWLYCSELLEATGIVVVPGSGFGQAKGTYHFRTTFLPPEEDIGGVVDKLSRFHVTFMKKYGGGHEGNGHAAAPAGEEVLN